MKKSVIAVSVLALLSLAGCASQSQIEEQNNQLAVISATLKQIQATQAEALVLQQMQTSVQIESKNLQTVQYQQQLQHK
ncbi:hypothetical protein [Pseudomonas sp. AB6]|uniref:hypothetical protein n=1 Tax=Pseudomonas sp. AB6 TaxID=3048598 RepID=UPI002AB59021|nr:hypothetical protein [Pseudomonas sp. AB6]MDY7563461.1 hypothetical protein [Pseudomonas sp. AB6]MEB0213468.1 hypothetical protein [Pseudomonas sp. AB6]